MSEELTPDVWMLDGSILKPRKKIRVSFRPATTCEHCGHVDYDAETDTEDVEVRLLDDGRDGRFDLVLGGRVGSYEVTMEGDGLVSVVAKGRVGP